MAKKYDGEPDGSVDWTQVDTDLLSKMHKELESLDDMPDADLPALRRARRAVKREVKRRSELN